MTEPDEALARVEADLRRLPCSASSVVPKDDLRLLLSLARRGEESSRIAAATLAHPAQGEGCGGAIVFRSAEHLAMTVLGIWDYPHKQNAPVDHVHMWAEAVAEDHARTAPPSQVGTEAEGMMSDPNVVHINMLRGGIAKPTPAQIGHLYRGDDAVEVVAEVRRQNPDAFAAEAEGMREKVAAAYVAGFRSSGEGWNGEWPFEGEPDDGEPFSSVIKKAHAYADAILAALPAVGEKP